MARGRQIAIAFVTFSSHLTGRTGQVPGAPDRAGKRGLISHFGMIFSENRQLFFGIMR
jgi:hypothetical protein